MLGELQERYGGEDRAEKEKSWDKIKAVNNLSGFIDCVNRIGPGNL